MLTTHGFFQEMLPLYFMMIIGFLARKHHIFREHANEVLTQLLLYITLPTLIIYSMQTTISEQTFIYVVWLLFMSFFVMNVSLLVARFFRNIARLPQSQKSAYESLIIFGNQGFIGASVAYLLLGELGIMYVTFFNIYYLILIWTYGIYLFAKKSAKIKWQAFFFNPGILATLIGLGMLFLPFSWPHVLEKTFEIVGKMTIPLSMLLIGSLIASIQQAKLKQYITNRYIWYAAGLRLLFIPATLFIFFLFAVPFPLIIIAVITSAMPSASTISVYAQKFGADASFAAVGVFLSTLSCVITIPLWYALLHWIQ